MDQKEKQRPEEMSSFFDVRAVMYEDHMKQTVNSFSEYYAATAIPIPKTQEPIDILDLGCGTGLELSWILAQAPHARLTCVDMSAQMLDVLQDTYREHRNQIEIVQESYVHWPFDERNYDFVVSVMTMHHFVYDEKLRLYQKIRRALRPGGCYIEGDYVVSPEREHELLEVYWQERDRHGLDSTGLYHIDIPFSLPVQKKLLKEAGFTEFEILFEEGEHLVYSVR